MEVLRAWLMAVTADEDGDVPGWVLIVLMTSASLSRSGVSRATA